MSGPHIGALVPSFAGVVCLVMLVSSSVGRLGLLPRLWEAHNCLSKDRGPRGCCVPVWDWPLWAAVFLVGLSAS